MIFRASFRDFSAFAVSPSLAWAMAALTRVSSACGSFLIGFFVFGQGLLRPVLPEVVVPQVVVGVPAVGPGHESGQVLLRGFVDLFFRLALRYQVWKLGQGRGGANPDQAIIVTGGGSDILQHLQSRALSQTLDGGSPYQR